MLCQASDIHVNGVYENTPLPSMQEEYACTLPTTATPHLVHPSAYVYYGYCVITRIRLTSTFLLYESEPMARTPSPPGELSTVPARGQGRPRAPSGLGQVG